VSYSHAPRRPPTVEALPPGELPAAASVLARAFRDNPGFVAMLGTRRAERRLSLLERLTPVLTRGYCDYGRAWVARDADGAIAGVALTAPPGVYPPRLAMELQINAGVVRAMPWITAARLGVADRILQHHHMKGRHHYLFMLGVDPTRQGQGFGGALLRELGTHADEDQLPCYLETDKLSSVQLYERHGYAVTHRRGFALFPDLTLWCMQRAAR
jgi:ribosomal protein S18 acetylase RimI-like enzyme